MYLLRAEALQHLGLKAAALSSVAKARDLEPDDLVAARRMMAWGSGEEQREAAIAVARFDSDIALVKAALLLLEQAGQDAFARVDVRDGDVAGWVTWTGSPDAYVTLMTLEGTRSIRLLPERKHQLASEARHAADFGIARPVSTEIQSLRVASAGRVVLDYPLPPNRSSAQVPGGRTKEAPNGRHHQPGLTVVVPIYGDVAATRACLSSLVTAARATDDCKVLLVNDASPEPAIHELLDEYAKSDDITILVNERNLGFVGAVNRALRVIPDGDVLLLNADTLVPKDALSRLRTVVTAHPAIGTATPLSNNGEFTSFPIANRANPLPEVDAVHRIDGVAAIANKDVVIDIPNGIGFCLYITRACLTAVRELSQDFYRGYLEDVDLCLRAAEAGFRNVCVPSVFVGHEGSRSFRQDKRSLVVRNLRVLEQRYPRYVAECAAFMLADPLRDSRGALESALLAYFVKEDLHLVLSGGGVLRGVAAARARQLATTGGRCWIIDFGFDGARLLSTVTDPAGAVPQSLQLDLTNKEQLASLLELLSQAKAVEIADIRNLPSDVLNFIRDNRIPYRMLIADGAIAANPAKKWGLRPIWRRFAEGAQAIVALDQRGAEFARDVLDLSPRLELWPKGRPFKANKGNASVLGVLALRSDAEEYGFVRDLATSNARKPGFRMTVLGSTLDDIKLMQLPNVLVTGSVSEDEIETLLEGHGISKLLLDIGLPLFGHPIKARLEATKLPRALVDWTGNAKLRKSDLRLAPELSRSKQISLLAEWAAKR
ncbi:glycosyltransferase family 2 protein [Bradyrhizobium guangzhouense]|nr:glycosyltransferase family 2 protein [Bradyrhizobium guangzhouense]